MLTENPDEYKNWLETQIEHADEEARHHYDEKWLRYLAKTKSVAYGIALQQYRDMLMLANISRADKLKLRQQQAIILAKEYREQHGDPIDKLSEILRSMVDDEEEWREIIEEYYS